MAETHNLTYDQQQAVESHAPYMKVFFTLLVFTVAEYIYAKFTQDHFTALVLGLMAMAITKAALVAIFFMHLKFEGRWVYFMLVPACVLAMGLILALFPDIGMTSSGMPDQLDEDILSAPAEPGLASAPEK
jgi:cytochrome c oxidase subunit 4